jgi:hypothetical protein
MQEEDARGRATCLMVRLTSEAMATPEAELTPKSAVSTAAMAATAAGICAAEGEPFMAIRAEAATCLVALEIHGLQPTRA